MRHGVGKINFEGDDTLSGKRDGDVMFTHCEEHGGHEKQPSEALAHYQKNGRSPEVVNCSRYASLQEESSIDW